jgi:hypothetical protein
VPLFEVNSVGNPFENRNRVPRLVSVNLFTAIPDTGTVRAKQSVTLPRPDWRVPELRRTDGT